MSGWNCIAHYLPPLHLRDGPRCYSWLLVSGFLKSGYQKRAELICVAVTLMLLHHKPLRPLRRWLSSLESQDGAAAILQKYLEIAW